MSDKIPKQRPHPSARACTACRAAHIKCNGLEPFCNRCAERGTLCCYTESKRGYRPAKNVQASQRSKETEVSSSIHLTQPQSGRGRGSSASTNIGQPGYCTPSLSEVGTRQPGIDNRSNQNPPIASAQEQKYAHTLSSPEGYGIDDHHVDLFYKQLYPSHPFVFPRQMHSKIPDYLDAVMRFAGKHYMSHPTTGIPAESQRVFSAPDNAFKVQALLLLTIISFSRNERNEGQVFQNTAVDLALQLGMHQRDFAIRYGESNSTIEESWRRTWWDLYMIDTLIAFLTGQPDASRLRSVVSDNFLPGDCESYFSCSASTNLKSYQDMQDRAFFDDGFEWSSYAYKIEAIHLLNSATALAADTFATTDPELELLDQQLQNFHLSLPNHKRDSLKPDGEVDEVMFGALMAANLGEIALHRPRSSFVSVQNHYRTACTPKAFPGITAIRYLSHDAKAIRAANAITNLITVPSSPTMHTPCFSCALTVATTIQLPAMVLNRSQDDTALKDRIRFAITAMGTIADVWPVAVTTKQQIAAFARDILQTSSLEVSEVGSGTRSSPTISTPTSMETFDRDLTINHNDWLVDLFDDIGDVMPTEFDGLNNNLAASEKSLGH